MTEANVTPIPMTSPRTAVRGSKINSLVGIGRLKRPQERPESDRDQDADAQPDRGRHHAHDGALTDHGA